MKLLKYHVVSKVQPTDELAWRFNTHILNDGWLVFVQKLLNKKHTFIPCSLWKTNPPTLALQVPVSTDD